MARTFQESIVNTTMFLPTAYDFLDTQATGMPNLDPCFSFKGLGVSGGGYDLRGYADAPTLSPNIFKVRSTGWALSLWFYAVGGANQNGTLFSAQTLISGGALDINSPLQITWAGLNTTSISLQYYGAAGNISMNRNTNNNNLWHFYVFNVPAPGQQATSFMNNGNFLAQHGVVAAGADTYASDMKIAFGRYGDSYPQAGHYTANRLGKMCFHNHVLTLTECQMLYQSMTP